MAGNQSCDLRGMSDSQIMAAAANDVQLGMRQQAEQALANGERTDRVGIAPNKQAWRRNGRQPG